MSSSGSLTEPRRNILFFPICHSVDGRPSDCIRILWRKSKGNYLSTNRYIFLSSTMTGPTERMVTVGIWPSPTCFCHIQIEGEGAYYALNIGLSPPDLKIFRRAWPWRDLETAHLVFYITNTHYATCSNKKNVRENFFNFLFLTSQTSAIFIST